MPAVSVIIPTIPGRESSLKRAVESILAQTYQDFEIIIITSGTLDYHLADSRITILELPQSNVSQARNYGIKNSRENTLHSLTMNDEELLMKLEKQIATLEKDDAIGLCYTNFYKVYSAGRKTINKLEPCGSHCTEELKRKS